VYVLIILFSTSKT